MEERGELVRRAGEGGMHSTVVLAGDGEGDVTDAGARAAAAPVPSEGRDGRAECAAARRGYGLRDSAFSAIYICTVNSTCMAVLRTFLYTGETPVM